MEATALYIRSFKFLLLPAPVIEVVSRGYIYLKGWSVSNMIAATKRKVNNAAGSAGKQVGSLVSFVSVSKTKRQLDFQKRSLEDITAVTNDLGALVAEVRREIAQLDIQLKDVNKLMECLEGRINEVGHELALTNQENHRLSRIIVSQGLEGGHVNEDKEGWERTIDEVAKHLDLSIQAILLLSRFVLRTEGWEDGVPVGSPSQPSQEQGSLVSEQHLI